MHKSVLLVEHPLEFINITPVNPLISKCQIKVCYVGDEPNRNRTVITKETARAMANSLPGSPIVGYFNENKNDFEEHNRSIEISNGEFKIKDTTRPYGFIDLNAKVWFAKYLDDDSVEREYLVTEGWLWTGQYPECKRVFNSEEGNNHSMELHEPNTKGTWAKDGNGKPKFFIINETIMEKLCILGESNEPCFEGSHITAPKIQFSFSDSFKEELFAKMNELQELLSKGGANKLFTKYAVEIGDALWSALYSYIEQTFPDGNNGYCSMYRIDGVYEENAQKFAILQNRTDMKYYRLNFSLAEDNGFEASNTLIEVTKSYTPSEEPQFSDADVQAFEAEYAKKNKDDKDKEEKEDKNKTDDKSEGSNSEEEEKEEKPAESEEDDEDEDKKKKKNNKFAKEDDKKCPKCGKPMDECTCEDEEDETNKDKKAKYNLDEIPEYVELLNNYSNLETKYNELVAEKESLESQMTPLVEFKNQAELKSKQDMIASFYMLSDEDKQDVVNNINTYSLDDIEAKLSIICVRNKVSFDLDKDNDQGESGPTTYTLNGSEEDDTPAWVKRAMAVAKTLN